MPVSAGCRDPVLMSSEKEKMMISKLDMAHEYICANAQAGKTISIQDAFEYVENMQAESAKIARKEMDALLNTNSFNLRFEPRHELSESIVESLGEIS